MDQDFEFTLEVNPGGWKKEDLDDWIKHGVNRFSIGLQSYDNSFLSYLDRIHRKKDIDNTLNLVNELGINFSVDLMLVAPFLRD